MNSFDNMDKIFDVIDRAVIRDAAKVRGISIQEFVRKAVLSHAESAFNEERLETLGVDAARDLLTAIDGHFAPNAKLKKALERMIAQSQK